MAQSERGRRDDGDRRAGIALAGENVEDDVGGVDAVGERFGTGRRTASAALLQQISGRRVGKLLEGFHRVARKQVGGLPGFVVEFYALAGHGN
jgi:hypothetical protein